MNTDNKAWQVASLLMVVVGMMTATPAVAQDGMQGMDMSSMHGMHMPAKESSTTPTSPANHSTHVMPMQEGGMSMEQGMSMHSSEPDATVEMQQLHFGQMIGTRPKLGGLAGAMKGMPLMQGMDMSSMQGGDAPPDARSSDYSDGYGYGSMPGMDMHDNPAIGMLLLDKLEYVRPRDGGHAVAVDGQAWYGKNLNKLWLKFEGEQADGRLQDLRTEALWDHTVSTYWDTQIGVRHDYGVGPDRTWAAFGIQGLAPYWFDVQATAYLGQAGRTAARASLEYEALLTQRLILQPELGTSFYGKDDPQRGIGSGLSDIEMGLRLRYEIRREFAPYVGIVWRQQFGRTADYARSRGESADDLQFVAGLRIWY